MNERVCRGLPADWLNGWLAAVGATVLVDGMRLGWTDEPVPSARLSLPNGSDPAEAIAQAWPTVDDMDTWPIVDMGSDGGALPLNPSLDQWRARVSRERGSDNAWMLSSLFTDLVRDFKTRAWTVDRGDLHPPAPTGRTMHFRLRALAQAPVDAEAVGSTLDGVGRRVSGQGLGFDLGRIGSLADATGQTVDPVIEILAFFGLALFPCRGSGNGAFAQRGSVRDGKKRSIQWPAWSAALDRWAIDALLDLAPRSWPPDIRALGTWQTVSFRSQSTMDPTRGHGSIRVRQT